jgi:tRNA pseudouridine32 synthase/23S rRNA pseudouridine746 synthase
VARTFKVKPKSNIKLIQLVTTHCAVSEEDSKALIAMGAVWALDPKMSHKTRIRDPEAEIKAGQGVGIFLDQVLLTQFQGGAGSRAGALDKPSLVSKQKEFEVWFKPSGWVSEGSPYGDHLSMERFASSGSREAHAVNRLDREVAGLMILSFSGKTFAELQKNWGLWRKVYQAEVLGQVEPQEVTSKLDGKEAKTVITSSTHHEATSLVVIELVTGRFHQIRRHLEIIGHPVLGDPKYGKGNKDPRGLRLRCVELAYKDWKFQVPSQYLLF